MSRDQKNDIAKKQAKFKSYMANARKKNKKKRVPMDVKVFDLLDNIAKDLDAYATILENHEETIKQFKASFTVLVAVADLLEAKGILNHDEIKDQIKKKIRGTGSIEEVEQSENRSEESVNNPEGTDGSSEGLSHDPDKGSIEDCSTGEEAGDKSKVGSETITTDLDVTDKGSPEEDTETTE